MNWPLYIALLLILLKQLFKLYLQHKPDRVDHLKSLAALPTDVSFLVVSLFIRQFAQPTIEVNRLLCFVLLYLVICVCTTVLWRVCDGAVSDRIHSRFMWAFPLNSAISGTTFYLALSLLK